MRHHFITLMLLLFIGANARAQAPFPSPEQFVNEIFPKVVDSSLPHYFLVAGTDTCRFTKYDYDDWADYHMTEHIPISILNDLAEKVYLNKYPYFWKQDSLEKAICITRRQADSILYLNPPDGSGPVTHFIFSFSLPQFTDDGQYAVIDLNMVCGGRCGVGTTYVFHHFPSGWKAVGEYTNWKTLTTGRPTTGHPTTGHLATDPHTSP